MSSKGREKTMLEIGDGQFSLPSFLFHGTYFTTLHVLSESLVRDLPFFLWLTNEWHFHLSGLPSRTTLQLTTQMWESGSCMRSIMTALSPEADSAMASACRSYRPTLPVLTGI